MTWLDPAAAEPVLRPAPAEPRGGYRLAEPRLGFAGAASVMAGSYQLVPRLSWSHVAVGHYAGQISEITGMIHQCPVHITGWYPTNARTDRLVSMERGCVSNDSAALPAAEVASPPTVMPELPLTGQPSGGWPRDLSANTLPASTEIPARTENAARTENGDQASRRLLFVAWRDLANRRAGGSEVLVDHLAAGMQARGDEVTLLCGGATAERQYDVIRNGGTYSQFVRAPLAYWRRLRQSDLVVEVCNGMPFFTPLWCGQPKICLVNHIHTELWRMMFPRPISVMGQFAESRVMPWVHRDNLFLTVSDSTADALREMGVADDRIRQICNGVMQPDPLTPRSPEPLFLAFGRLIEYKRIDMLLRLWDRVRQEVGSKLAIAGDGPERSRLEALAGPDVIFTGRVS